MPPSSFISTILSVFVCFCSTTTFAQEKPKYTPAILQPNVTLRQNVCDRHHDYYSGKVKLREALADLEIHPLFDVYDDRLFKLTDGRLDAEDPGVIPTIMDELAKRAGFTWRNSFAVVDVSNGVGNNNTWQDLLVWGVESFDVYCDWYANTVERLKLGIGFPEGFYDASYILVGMKSDVDSGKADLFNWLEPFESKVWYSILVTIFISAIFIVILENVNQHTEEKVMSLSNGLFLSSLVFTQHVNFTPKSQAGRLFIASFAFWALIVISTYTANLASFFVVQNAPQIQINSIDEAVQANMRLCLWEGTASDTYVSLHYPKGILVKKATEEETILGIDDGECDLAIVSLQSWLQFENYRNINENCNLAWMGRVIKFADAGFGMKNDAGVLCSSLLQDILNVHLIEMNADGFIEKTWQDAYSKNQDISCSNQVGSAQSDEDSAKLSLDEMAGTFFVHFLAALIALIMAGTEVVKSRYCLTKNFEDDDDVDPVDADSEIGDSVSPSVGSAAVNLHGTTVYPLGSQSDLQKQLREICIEQQEMRTEQKEQRELITKLVSIVQKSISEKSERSSPL